MSKTRSQDEATTLRNLREHALLQAARHLQCEGGGGATVWDLLDRARAYAVFLDGGCVGAFERRAAMLDVAHGLANELGDLGDVVAHAGKLLRYVEEGA